MSIEAQQRPIAVLYDNVQVPAQDAPAPPVPKLDPEQSAAAEMLFREQEKEAEQVQSVMGLWMGTALLHDLALEHFKSSKDDEEEEIRNREKKKPRVPDEM